MNREFASCAGFALPPTARRWMPINIGGGAVRRRSRHSAAASPLGTQMSIREMIGADVESGGLFDPLGEGNSVFTGHGETAGT